MKELKGTKTEQNLKEAFAGESHQNNSAIRTHLSSLTPLELAFAA